MNHSIPPGVSVIPLASSGLSSRITSRSRSILSVIQSSDMVPMGAAMVTIIFTSGWVSSSANASGFLVAILSMVSFSSISMRNPSSGVTPHTLHIPSMYGANIRSRNSRTCILAMAVAFSSSLAAMVFSSFDISFSNVLISVLSFSLWFSLRDICGVAYY